MQHTVDKQQIRRLLLAAIVCAVALRLGAALVHGNEVAPLPGVFDQLSYHQLAQRLLTGHGFSFGETHWPITRGGEPTAHWSYLYTGYLTILYALFGVTPLIPRLVQAVVVGILHTWLAYRIGRRIFGPTVGLASALISALYLYFVYYGGALMTEPFYIVGILWTLDAALRLSATRRSRWYQWLELGLAIGITGLLRQVFLLFVPVLVLWLFWTRGRRATTQGEATWMRSLGGTFLGLALAGLVTIALIAPWTVRNYQAFGVFVPLNTNSGYAFFWGNHPIYGTRFVGILPADGPSYQELIPEELRHLNEAELDKALLARGVAFVMDDPARYALLSLSRTQEYFKFWPSSESSTLSNIARVGSFGLLLPFLLYGLWHTIFRWWGNATRSQRAGALLLLLFAGIYTTMHLLTWALIRYRLPVDAVLIPFAASGMVNLAARIGLLAPGQPGVDSTNELRHAAVQPTVK